MQLAIKPCIRCQSPFGQAITPDGEPPHFHCPVCGYHVIYQGDTVMRPDTYGAYCLVNHNGTSRNGSIIAPLDDNVLFGFRQIFALPDTDPRESYVTLWNGHEVCFVLGSPSQSLRVITTFHPN